MESVMVGPVLKVNAGSICFPVELYVQCKVQLQMENVSRDFVGFRVKTNAAQKYFTEPPSAVLPPGGSMVVTVTMRAQSEKLVGVETKDKFLVQSVVMPWGASESNLPNNLRELGQPVYEARLPVTYADPHAAPPLDVPSPGLPGPQATSAPQVAKDVERAGEVSPAGTDEVAALKRLVEEQEATIAQLREDLASANEAAAETELKGLEVSAPSDPPGNEREEELEALRQAKEELERENRKLQAALLESQNLATKREEEALAAQEEAEQGAQKKVNATMMALRSEVSGMRAQCSTLLSQMEEVEARRAAEAETVYELRRQLAALQESTSAKLETSEETAVAPVTEGPERVPSVQRWELEAMEAEQAETAAMVAQLRGKLGQAEHQAAAARAFSASLQDELTLTKESCTCLQQDLETAEEQLVALKMAAKRSAGLTHSTSMKVKQAEAKASREAEHAELLRRELEIVRVEIEASRVAIDNLQSKAESFLEEKMTLEDVLSQLEITDARHSQHTLKLMPCSTNQPYAGTTGTFVCSACFRKGSSWVWQCSDAQCDYDLHIGCSTLNSGRDPRSTWT